MDYDYPKEINGINLADYYPNQRSYNSVVYVHKKSVQKMKKEKKEKERKEKEAKEKKAKKKSIPKCGKCDKCQQCDQEINNEFIALNNSLFAQNLQLTNSMIPLVLPPNGITSPIYYTIKATKKTKDKKKTKAEISTHTHTLKKEKSKTVIETYRNEAGKESLSVKETVSYSSRSDTLEELHMNASLCCTLSEISDNKHVKREKRDKSKHDAPKVVTSDSFEALATEFLNTSGDTKIKIHLMNETEKNVISENIRMPVLNAIRECIAEINKQKHNAESTMVQKFIRCNDQKLDNIMDKLKCIEQKLDHLDSNNTKTKVTTQNAIENKSNAIAILKSPKNKLIKPSTLEQLGEDLLELVEDNSVANLEAIQESSSDEYYKPTLSARKKMKGRSEVIHLDPTMNDEMNEVMGGGEVSHKRTNLSQSDQLVKPDKAGRIPARFCWTDANRKNVAS